MLSFDGMRSPPPSARKQYLKTDWSAEEKSFRDGIPAFLESIKDGNALTGPVAFEYREEKSDPQSGAAKQVAEKVQKNAQSVQEARQESVISTTVLGPNCGPNDIQPTQPAQPRHSVSSVNDDDLFDFAAPAKTPATSQKPAEAPKVQDPFGDDFVAEPVAPKPTVQTAAKPIEAKVDSPKGESKVQQSQSVTAPKQIAQPAAVEQKQSEASLLKSPEIRPASELKELPPMEGFDYDRFEHIRRTADRMLEALPDVDLAYLDRNLVDYSVDMDLDAHRDNPSILSQKLLEVQAKRDSLFVEILRIAPWRKACESAADYYSTSGLECANGKNKESRLAQIYNAIPEFWVRHSRIERTYDSVERTYKHLEGQYEMLSRLITCLQMKMKIGDVARGEMPFEMPPPQRTAPKPVPAAPSSPPPVLPPDDEMVNRQMSQPLVPKIKNAEDFKLPSRPVQKRQDTVSGIVDF